MNQQFQKEGYILHKAFCSDDELRRLRSILLKFHEKWKRDHAEYYNLKAVNSAYITKQGLLDEPDRQWLFQFLLSVPFTSIAQTVFKNAFVFMNTQLFFDPVNPEQKNYWHRDPQYHLSIEEQKTALLGPQVNHFRIPLFDEPGIELIPTTHLRWDSSEEKAVRLEENGHCNHEDLSHGLSIPLEAGDLLVFSANMIHRGLYGKDRLTLDVLLCDRHADLMGFIDTNCSPNKAQMVSMGSPDLFLTDN